MFHLFLSTKCSLPKIVCCAVQLCWLLWSRDWPSQEKVRLYDDILEKNRLELELETFLKLCVCAKNSRIFFSFLFFTSLSSFFLLTFEIVRTNRLFLPNFLCDFWKFFLVLLKYYSMLNTVCSPIRLKSIDCLDTVHLLILPDFNLLFCVYREGVEKQLAERYVWNRKRCEAPHWGAFSSCCCQIVCKVSAFESIMCQHNTNPVFEPSIHFIEIFSNFHLPLLEKLSCHSASCLKTHILCLTLFSYSM